MPHASYERAPGDEGWILPERITSANGDLQDGASPALEIQRIASDDALGLDAHEPLLQGVDAAARGRIKLCLSSDVIGRKD